MDKEPFITIGIASYNYANFLPKAFEKIKNQDFKDYELLYCDDGSTDSSVEVIHSFISNNPDMNIRLVKGDNQGVIANKKRIIDNARGTYIMVCDADDWISDNGLTKLASEAQKSNADRVIGQFSIVYSDESLIRTCDISIPSIKWVHTLWHGCLFKRSIFLENQMEVPFDFYSDDYYLITTYNIYCKKVAYVRENVYFNRFHENNTSRVRCLDGAWKPKDNFLQVLKFSSVVSKKLSKQDDYDALMYQVTKFYYQALLSAAKVTTHKGMRTFYKELNSSMRKEYPQYLQNKQIVFIKSNFDRKYGKKGIYLMSLLERYHLLLIALILYGKIEFSALINAKQKD